MANKILNRSADMTCIGNALNIPTTIDSNTVLEFEFRTTEQGEEHAIGFTNVTNNDAPLNGSRIKLYGTQAVPASRANLDFTYNGSGDWQSFSIPVGNFITGAFQYLAFINDNDASPNNGNSSFKNIKLLAPNNCSINNIPLVTVGFITPANNADFIDGVDLQVDASASSTAANIDNVQLFLNGNLVRQENPSPNNWGLPNGNDTVLQGLALGTYTLRLVATDVLGNSAENTITVNVNSSTGGNPGSSIDLAFNFGTQATNTPLGFIEDIGNPFGLQGSLNYGWVNKNTNAPIDVTNMARNRPPAIDADPIRETLIHMNRLQSLPDANWEIEIPNGTYRVVLQEGDPNNEGRAGTRHLIKVEGTTLIDFEPGTGFGTRTGVAEVIITDGKLTIDGSDGINAKICAVSIQSTDVLQFPAIVGAIPLDGATNVDLNTSISANFLSFPNVSA